MERTTDNIAILGIGTAVPAHRLDQHDVAERLAEALRDEPDSMRWAKRIFRQCGVATRYTCEPNLLEPASRCRYFPAVRPQDAPSTAERMGVYRRESVPLGVEAAQKALHDADTEASEITHLLTVSCTGQFLPGLDAALVGQLGLSARIDRIPLTFLGCAAGLKAIQIARNIAHGTPGAKVLIVCVELCTLHFQPSGRKETLFPASFFGDGASACVIGIPGDKKEHVFLLENGDSVLLPDSSGDMMWELGNSGFELHLSTGIPKLLGRHIPEEIGRILDGEILPQLWAIHPGGRGIVDTLQDLFDLTDEQTRYSRDVLFRYGNMSSATIIFVLHSMREGLRNGELGGHNLESSRLSGIALAFGPGLTAEFMKFTYVLHTSGLNEYLKHVRDVQYEQAR